MASVRAAVRQHALELAHHADAQGTACDVTQVPRTVIEQLRRTAGRAERPTSTLRWAWRSQRASYLDTNQRADALASVFLHAALLADECRDA